jgi:hypothetical protein
VESRLLGFPCFPYSVISMASFGKRFTRHKHAEGCFKKGNRLSELFCRFRLQRSRQYDFVTEILRHVDRFAAPTMGAMTPGSASLHSGRRPRLLIADDHVLIAQAFQNLLEPEFQVVGVVSDGRQLLESVGMLNLTWSYWTSQCRG